MDTTLLSLDDPSVLDMSWYFPQPAFVSQRLSLNCLFSGKAQPNPGLLTWYKLGDNHEHVYRAQRFLNCRIRGDFGLPWKERNGSPWRLLPEDGMLSLNTQYALQRFQEDWDLPTTGCLCPRTRALLPPLLRLRGSLRRKSLRFPRLCWTPKYGPSSRFGRLGGSSGSPSRSSTQGAQPSPTPQPTPTPVVPADKKKEEEDSPWTLNWGFGGSGPLWTSKSSTGKSVKPDKLEVDQKTEVDFSIPTPLALGDGHLKLSIGAEYDVPLDNDHLGKPTIAGNFQLQADDLYKRGPVSLAPFLKYSPQWQRDGNGWKESNVLKGGLELDVDLFKGGKLEADVNSGVQLPGPSSDKDTTAKAIVPLEGNLNFILNF